MELTASVLTVNAAVLAPAATITGRTGWAAVFVLDIVMVVATAVFPFRVIVPETIVPPVTFREPGLTPLTTGDVTVSGLEVTLAVPICAVMVATVSATTGIVLIVNP